MSIARHHAEWLTLTEVSGPFLSMPVLQRVFPQGLDAHDPEHRKELLLAYQQWQDVQESVPLQSELQRAWIRFVLQQTLGFTEEVLFEGSAIPASLEAAFPLHAETLRPDFAVLNPADGADAGKGRLLVAFYPARQDLERPVDGRRWPASPATRMMELCHATGVRLGLLSNGEHWMLVHAPHGETTGFASWYAALWFEEPLTLRAFRSLLSLRRFFGVPDDDTPEGLFRNSASEQQDVTDQLGLQVRRAVEVLVQALDRIDKDTQRLLLAGVDEKQLYAAALTVMMRLVFLFSAEERKLLLLGDPLYDQHYAVSTLRAQLRESADRQGEEVLERRHDAWGRLLATFRAVHGGLHHDRLMLPAYGGTLFDPDLYPFLEGRRPGTSWRRTAAVPLLIHNRTVLHLLEALQVLQAKSPGSDRRGAAGAQIEARILSFRALDIEQIGHVYEGLLDHGAVRATQPVLGLLGTKGQEPEIPLSELEEKAIGNRQSAAGSAEQQGLQGTAMGVAEELVGFLREETGRSESALRKALAGDVPIDDRRLLVACDNDEALAARVRPFAALLRSDTSGYPLVVTTGSLYVTQIGERRSTGTHYTPRSLTEPIVQHTLDPLVYAGMADGVAPSPETLRTPREILELKVCDFACGSGAFLVQACRYLADKLVEAWSKEEGIGSGQSAVGGMRGAFPAEKVVLTSPWAGPSRGLYSETLLPADPLERRILARRLVADRCLYGVDKNPQAVEMAKLSLWLTTMQRERPFTFLDHALRCGDSLLGLTSADQLIAFDLDPASRRSRELKLWGLDQLCRTALHTAAAKRRELESFSVKDVRDAQHKHRLLQEADQALAQLRVLSDLVVSEALATAGRKPTEDQQEQWSHVLHTVISALNPKTSEEGRAHLWNWLEQDACQRLGDRKPFHWFLEFPEVFSGKGAGSRESAVGSRQQGLGRGGEHEHPVVSGLEGMAAGDGSGRGLLSVDQGFSQGGAVRDDLPDPTGWGLDPGQHRGGLWPGREEGVHAVSEGGSGKPEGTGDASALGKPGRSFHAGIHPAAAESDGGHRQDAVFAPEEAGATLPKPLIPPAAPPLPAADSRLPAPLLLESARAPRSAADRSPSPTQNPIPPAAAPLLPTPDSLLPRSRSPIPDSRLPIPLLPGFDAIVGNPPFLGGTKLEPVYGASWRDYVVNHIAQGRRGVRGTTDLCTYFFLRGSSLMTLSGTCGLIATNTISQGDSREVGLDWIIGNKRMSIIRAVPSKKWPGTANLEVSLVWLYLGKWSGIKFLDEFIVQEINSLLEIPGRTLERSYFLVANADKSIEGAKVQGMGFVLEVEEAKSLILLSERNRDVIFPYLTGQDINSSPDQSPSRWIINFNDWPLNKESAPEGYDGPVAADYPDCLRILEERVKPERLAYPPDSPWNRSIRERWWQFGLPRPALSKAISGMQRVLSRSVVSNINSISFQPTNIVFSHTVKVFAFDSFQCFALLQSAFHTIWIDKYSSSMRTDVRYTSAACFDPFPFPLDLIHVSPFGMACHEFRDVTMKRRQEGLTKTYNRFHNPDEHSADIVRLRELHVEMDNAVRDAYGWSDLDLQHGFHETKQGMRYTISEAARREVLDRLLALNHERYADEVARGLHEKPGSKGKKAAAKKTKAISSPTSVASQSPSPASLQPPEAQPLGLFDQESQATGSRESAIGSSGEGIGNRQSAVGGSSEPDAATTQSLSSSTADSQLPTPSSAADSLLTTPYSLALDVLRTAGKPLSKAEILSASSLPESAWPKLLARLLDSGQIQQQGQKRGTRYTLAESSENQSPGTKPSDDSL